MTLSGRFDRIVLRDCLNVSLVGVSARHIEILDSTVALRDVRVDADPGETGLKIRSSHVTATDLTITGAPAASIGGSHFDAAGATFRSDAAAVVIEASSALVLSVSTMRSEVYNGYLHGAADAAHTNLGALPAIRSTFTDGVSASERR